MLEKPDLAFEKIITCLQDDYGLHIAQIDFLPIGADQNTAVYHALTGDGTPYFVKLRSGVFDETSVALPQFLSEQGIRQAIAPLAAKSGQLWSNLDPFKTILYPFIEGCNGYQVEFSDHQWVEFGAVLKRIQMLNLPPALANRISSETYPPQGREIVKSVLARLETDVVDEMVAVKMAAFVKTEQELILDLVTRADRYARLLQARTLDFVLCHSDIHAGNILVNPSGAFYIVDWDNPILAPKERDLMFIGGGQGFRGHTPQQEETLFYRGYGPTRVDPVALAYYRCERIVQDIAIYCENILFSDQGGDDREQSFLHFRTIFQPGGPLEAAYPSEKSAMSDQLRD